MEFVAERRGIFGVQLKGSGMFEVGKTYEIRMVIDGEETTIFRQVEAYDHPLVKFADVVQAQIDFVPEQRVPGEILNVTSPSFVGAVCMTSSVES
ncbi:hypothetical protein J8J14_24555 [Roseomonas sp. SSH11]|uniref:Uncharacterized protein n=1 Tax=Pararoseomonas baculiformis TaxID=2820812 RepID=A0ABS4ALK8_9PROT|nr:hypothetical protein [Pararoseomonas baculiformis]MBP0447903.1 hypothetical protein [Pararoseomonas baculiformis]